MELTFGLPKILKIFEQVHSGRYYTVPKLAVGTLLTSGAAPWTLGAYVEVVPASIMTQYGYVVGIYMYGVTVNTDYIVELAIGPVGSESTIFSAYHSVQSIVGGVVAQTIIPAVYEPLPVAVKIPKDTRVSARCADSTGGLTIRTRVKYKT
ncbi:MAG: hypothetical protein PHH85_02040 [Candidatus Methanoperedens sp.]|nr:hypothetical protein [Candidatus Methanoperedens sp.]